MAGKTNGSHKSEAHSDDESRLGSAPDGEDVRTVCSDDTDSDDTMYFSDCDVQFLPEVPERDEFANTAYEVMYDVMSKQMVKNWRSVKSIFAEQFDPAHLCKEEYVGPRPWQFKTFEEREEAVVHEHPNSRERNKTPDLNDESSASSLPKLKRSPRIEKLKHQNLENQDAARASTSQESADGTVFDSTFLSCLPRDSEIFKNFSLLETSVWPAECCEACRFQGELRCQCPVMISMPYAMLDGEQPTAASPMDMQPVVRALKLAQQSSEVRIILPYGSHQRGRVAQMEHGRAIKYPTYDTCYIKPLPAGNFWLPLANNMHARDLTTYRVVPYISEDIDIAKWEQEYSEMHEQRRDRAAYRRVRDCLFNNSQLLTKVVRKMHSRLAPAKKRAGIYDKNELEQSIFKTLSNAVPNAPSPDELYEQKYLFPNDAAYRNRICVPSLDSDPKHDCSYEKRMHTFLTLYCPRCRVFDCHEHEHKQCAPVPEIIIIPLLPPPAQRENWCSPSKHCFAAVYDKVKAVGDFEANDIVMPELSVCAKTYLDHVLHGPKVIPGYYANTFSTNSMSASAMLLASGSAATVPPPMRGAAARAERSNASNSTGLCDSHLCCEVTETVNSLLTLGTNAEQKKIRCVDAYLYYLDLLSQKGYDVATSSCTLSADPEFRARLASVTSATASSSRGGKRRGSTASNLASRKRPSFKQAPAYKAMQSSRQLSKLPHEPCHHPKYASCSEAAAHSACICAKRKIFCEKFCSCDDRCCGNRVRFCTCTSGCNSLRCPCYVAERECDPHRCRCQQIGMCKNMAMQLGLKKKIVVAQSSTHGFGVFVMEDAKEGEFVYEYMGEKVSDYEAERRGRFYDKLGLSFLFGLNAEESIDATRCGNKIRFANHSERHANLAARIMSVFGDHRIGLYALRDLKRGEELFFNYFYKGAHLKFVPNEPTALPPLRGMALQTKAATSRMILRREEDIDEAEEDGETAAGNRDEQQMASSLSVMGKKDRRNGKVGENLHAPGKKRRRTSKQARLAAADGEAEVSSENEASGAEQQKNGGKKRTYKKRNASASTVTDSPKQNGSVGAGIRGLRSPSYDLGNSNSNSSFRRAGILDAMLGEEIEDDDQVDGTMDVASDAVDTSQLSI